MAIVDWPTSFGYTEFSETTYRSRGPYVQRSVFTGRVHTSFGGSSRRRGYVITPASRANGTTTTEVNELVRRVSDPVNQLRFALPGTSGALEFLVVHVVGIRPPERDAQGIWRGWRLEFVQTEPPRDYSARFTTAVGSVDEGGVATATVRIALDAPAGGLTIDYQVGGTATSGVDYTSVSGSVHLAEGNRTADISVATLLDAAVEPPETVILTLVVGTGYSLGALTTWTLTIRPREYNVRWAAAPVAIEEGSTAVARVIMDYVAPAGGFDIDYDIEGTAVSGMDYLALSGNVHMAVGSSQVDVSVVTLTDALVESDETVSLVLLASGMFELGNRTRWTLTISPRVYALRFMETETTIVEGGTVRARVVIDHDAPVGGFDIGYSIGGTATAGLDYTALSGSIRIEAGNRSADISLVTLTDSVADSPETVILTLLSSTAYDLGALTVWTATLVLQDYAVSFAGSMTSVVEGATATAIVSLAAAAPVGGLTIHYSIGGTATEGVDYTALSGMVIVAAGDTTAEIDVVTVEDSVEDDAETVILTLLPDPLYTLGNPTVWTLIIMQEVTSILDASGTGAQDSHSFTVDIPAGSRIRMSRRWTNRGDFATTPVYAVTFYSGLNQVQTFANSLFNDREDVVTVSTAVDRVVVDSVQPNAMAWAVFIEFDALPLAALPIDLSRMDSIQLTTEIAPIAALTEIRLTQIWVSSSVMDGLEAIEFRLLTADGSQLASQVGLHTGFDEPVIEMFAVNATVYQLTVAALIYPDSDWRVMVEAV